ncbi:MAG TPA: hypothetical protein PKJ16_09830 [Spirochaetota bacterium]|nr:hypothetical protein [Spirochaetota bacterium]HOS40347.1 hypothetical protein [Spirochaetota bacterium]HPU88834.1 hypothetical protein [Spirochaetota bacterium]
MAIDTTLNVHESTLRRIDRITSITGRARNRVIVDLLTRVMSDRGKQFATGCTVRYQRRDNKEKWRTVHVRLSEDEVDYFRDLRGVYKRSESLLLAEAAREYLSDIIREALRGVKSDNHPFQNYVLSRHEAEGLIFWTICWGFPPTPQNHFKL